MSDTLERLRSKLDLAAGLGESLQEHWNDVAALLDIAEAAQQMQQLDYRLTLRMRDALAALDSAGGAER